MKLQNLTALSISMLLAASAHADVAGASSNINYIQVGGTELDTTNPHPSNPDSGHTGEIGSPGIGVYASKTPFKKVALSGLRGLSLAGLGGNYNFGKDTAFIDETRLLMQLSGHGDFGHYAFSKESVGSGDNATEIYFGEWNDENDITDGSHTVYYVGKDKTSNMPSSGTAVKYQVRGINDVRNSDILNGEFTANFVTNKIGGTLSNSTLDINIDNNTIDPSTASFSGAAQANGNIQGTSQGEFFGNEAAALGGIATFENNIYDTAFAGIKK